MALAVMRCSVDAAVNTTAQRWLESHDNESVGWRCGACRLLNMLPRRRSGRALAY